MRPLPFRGKMSTVDHPTYAQMKQSLKANKLKAYVTEVVNNYFAPIREKRAEIAEHSDHVREVLHEGNRRANEIANATLDEVRSAMGMVY